MASGNDTTIKYDTLVTNEDHRAKIESAQFVYVVAKSGVGKTFTGDYLGTIQNFKHIDGDCILKMSHTNEHWKKIGADEKKKKEGLDLTDPDSKMKKIVELMGTEDYYQPFCFELARLLLEAAKTSQKCVLTHATFDHKWRLLIRKYLKEAGVKNDNFTMMFLDIDPDVHNKAAWKRWNFQAECNDCTLEELFENVCKIPGIKDFDSFVTIFQEGINNKYYTVPQEQEKPYVLVDVSARDVTVLDQYDKVLGLNARSTELTYDEMIEMIAATDKKRDEEWGKGMIATAETEKEKEVANKEPEKYIARRSSLFEADKILDRMSSISIKDTGDTQSHRRSRQSFIETGKFV